MRASLLVAIATILPAAATGQVPTNAVTDLARGWAPNTARVACQKYGPRGEYLGAGNQYCAWTPAAGSSLGVTVSAGAAQLALATWERPVKDIAEASRLVDSLGRALRARGFVQRECGRNTMSDRVVSSTLWEGKDAAVLATRVDLKSGQISVTTMATIPAAMPAIIRDRFCKGGA
jgi:hypothetical protein